MFRSPAHLFVALKFARPLRPWVASFVALVLLVPRSVWASGSAPPVTIEYDAPAGVDCPDVTRFREGVAARLGYDPFADEAKRLVRVRVRKAAAGLQGTVELFDDRGGLLGEKTLGASRCDDLISAMTLAAGMAIDPLHSLRPLPAASAEADAPSVTAPPAPSMLAAPLPSPAPAPDAATPARSRVVPSAFVEGGIAGFGPVPGVAPAFGLGAGFRYGAFSIDLAGRFVAPASEAAGAGQVRTSTIGVALLPCVHPGFLFVCGDLFLGALQGSASGIDAPEEATTFFSQAGLRLGLSVPVSRMRVEPFGEALATLTGTSAEFRGARVWSTQPLGFSTGIRLAYPFL